MPTIDTRRDNFIHPLSRLQARLQEESSSSDRSRTSTSVIENARISVARRLRLIERSRPFSFVIIERAIVAGDEKRETETRADGAASRMSRVRRHRQLARRRIVGCPERHRARSRCPRHRPLLSPKRAGETDKKSGRPRAIERAGEPPPPFSSRAGGLDLP